jgi:hypothetical protein
MANKQTDNKKPMQVGGVQQYGQATGKPACTGKLTEGNGKDLRSGK